MSDAQPTKFAAYNPHIMSQGFMTSNEKSSGWPGSRGGVQKRDDGTTKHNEGIKTYKCNCIHSHWYKVDGTIFLFWTIILKVIGLLWMQISIHDISTQKK